MRKLILASHGSLAEGMKSAVHMILNESAGISAYGLDTHETPDKVLALVRAQITAEPDTEFIILCDVKGGSVHNKLMELLLQPNAYILAGMNLIMALELYVAAEGNPKEAIAEILKIAKEGIQFYDAEEIMRKKSLGEEGELW